MTSSVRLHVFRTGTMTSPLGGFLEGESGLLTYPVLAFLIEHPEGLVAVDAGFHPELATSSSRLGPLEGVFTVNMEADGSSAVGAQFRAAGFDPEQVEQVIVTHLHFDHVGGLVDLPNGRLIIQSGEWASRNDERFVSTGGYNPDDFSHGHEVGEIAGDHDVFGDGTVTCLLTDGHTPGHQSVRVQTEDGTFVICGDCCYLRKTLLDEHLPPSGVDRDRQLAAVRRMAGEQRFGATLIFGHDPEQWERVLEHGLASQI